MSWRYAMAEKPRARFLRLIEVLVRHEVEFIVVGGVAAILEGAPVLTLDLDVLIRQTPENIERVVTALAEVHAHYRDPAGRTILPDATRLAANRLNLLVTDLGPFDVLVSLVGGLGYDDLAGRTRTHEVSGLAVQALTLDALIEIKERTDRDKDRAVLPVLRRTLEMKRSLSPPPPDEEGVT